MADNVLFKKLCDTFNIYEEDDGRRLLHQIEIELGPTECVEQQRDIYVRSVSLIYLDRDGEEHLVEDDESEISQSIVSKTCKGPDSQLETDIVKHVHTLLSAHSKELENVSYLYLELFCESEELHFYCTTRHSIRG